VRPDRIEAMTAGGGPTASRQSGPRRSGLAQERSRKTRRDLVRAALALWTQRGFEKGVEETTVDEIAQAAGVTKGTFYFHFAHKEDILLELGWGAGDVAFAAAADAMAENQPALEVMDRLLTKIAANLGRAPRMVVARSFQEFYRRSPDSMPSGATAPPRHGFRHAFADVIAYGRDRGEFPDGVDPIEIGAMLEVVVMEAVMGWARGRPEPLPSLIKRYAGVVLAGASGLFVVDLPLRRRA
jgi:AcrR family transcriptional regulator